MKFGNWPYLSCAIGCFFGGAGASCGWQEGVNFLGADIIHYPAASPDECCTMCSANPNCVAVTLSIGQCYLKANATSSETKHFHSSAVVRDVAGVHQGGRYGRWQKDEFGFPAYVYTCDQTTDDMASHPISINWVARAAREHVFQLGNSRLTLIANNFGAFKVRQDEGGPKWLNDAQPAKKQATQFGGGFGYVLDEDSNVELSTYYDGGSPPTEREFGIGYARQVVQGSKNISATHTVAVPPGDDPVILTEVVLRNTGSEDRTVQWVEVWGSRMVHMSLLPAPADARIFAKSHYSHAFERSDINGDAILSHKREFKGLTDLDKTLFEASMKSLNIPTPLAPGATLVDEHPPPFFLAAIDKSMFKDLSFGTDAKTFFDGAGPSNPAAQFSFEAAPPTDEDAALIARAQGIVVPAGGEVALHFVSGYLPDAHASAEDLVAKWRGTLVSGNLAREITSAWRSRLPMFSMPSRPWLEEEMLWHAYYLQGGVSYDDYFGEYIVDQGMSYRYSWGFQSAARDPLQHMLPLISQDPAIAKSVLRYTLKEVQSNPYAINSSKAIDIPYGMTGHGVLAPLLWNPDDFEFYMLLSAAEYVLATRDLAFLEEPIHFYNDSTTRTVLQVLQHVTDFILEVTGTGPHGLVRFLSSDWDDGLSGPTPDSPDFNVSESVLTASLATYVLPRFADVLRLRGDDARAAKAEEFAQRNREGLVSAAWNGKYLRRAFFGEAGWIGDLEGERAGMFSAPHAWAMLGGVFDQTAGVVETITSSLVEHCREGWPYGFAYECDSDEGSAMAGNWWAVDHPMVLGLADVGQTELAWEEFERNSMNWEATVRPDIWAGLWTSADSVSSDGLPGTLAYQFPALCMHRHAWPQVSLMQLAGLQFTGAGVHLRPAIPLRLGAYNLTTPLASIAWDGIGTWRGWYRPPSIGELGSITIEADLSRVLDAYVAPLPRTLRARPVGGEWITSEGTGMLKISVQLSGAGLEFEVRQQQASAFV